MSLSTRGWLVLLLLERMQGMVTQKQQSSRYEHGVTSAEGGAALHVQPEVILATTRQHYLLHVASWWPKLRYCRFSRHDTSGEKETQKPIKNTKPS